MKRKSKVFPAGQEISSRREFKKKSKTHQIQSCDVIPLSSFYQTSATAKYRE